MEDLNKMEEADQKVLKPVPNLVRFTAFLNYLILGTVFIWAIVGFVVYVANANIDSYLGKKAFNLSVLAFLLITLILFISIYGAGKMHKGRKRGFIFYTIGMVIIGLSMSLLAYVSSLNNSSFDFIPRAVGAGLAFLFIIIFATQLKHLN
ncbi:MAG: hypothetical protein ACI8ZM_005289 [Crocinitomix sp.]|jgi:hypothetical protein